MEGKEVADGARATLPASGHGGETEVVGKERWEEIRRLRQSGLSVSAIARQLDLDRKTVRGRLAKSAWQPYRREEAAQTLLTPHLAWLEALPRRSATRRTSCTRSWWPSAVTQAATTR